MKQPGPHKPDRLARLIRFVPDHERRVIALATQGRTAAQIAEIMDITETQAAATMNNMLPQLNLDSWDAATFQTRPVRRALEQARRRYGYDEGNKEALCTSVISPTTPSRPTSALLPNTSAAKPIQLPSRWCQTTKAPPSSTPPPLGSTPP